MSDDGPKREEPLTVSTFFTAGQVQRRLKGLLDQQSLAQRIGLAESRPQPTPEEEEERRHWQEQQHVETEAAIAALAAVTDPFARALLDLHAPEGATWPECTGCDFDGYDAERPSYPCRTVILVAEHQGIKMPASWWQRWSR